MHSDATMHFPRQATRYVWRHTGKRAIQGISASARVARNSVMRLLSRADYARWSSADGLESWWEQRTRQMAALIPGGSRVVEFGAGRRALENVLPPACIYTPSDLVDRGPGTLICDLNDRPLPDLNSIAPSVAVFAGVLEYISDIPAIIDWLGKSGVTTVVISYDAVPAEFKGLRRMKENWRRSYFGYMSSMTEREFVFAFAHCGFMLAEKQQWTTQGIYRFVRPRT